MCFNLYLYNNQINASSLIGQSAVGYCAGKSTRRIRKQAHSRLTILVALGMSSSKKHFYYYIVILAKFVCTQPNVDEYIGENTSCHE